MRAFMVKCEERPLEGEVCEIPVRPPMNDGAMETVECLWVDILGASFYLFYSFYLFITLLVLQPAFK